MSGVKSNPSFWRRNIVLLVGLPVIALVWFGQREMRGRPSPPPAMDESVPARTVFDEEGSELKPPLGEATRRPRLVEFYTDSCPACKAMKPSIHALRDDYQDGALEVVLLNLSDPRNEHLASRYRLVGVPTVSLFDPTGVEVGRMQGAVSLRALRKAATQLTETP